MKSQIRVIINDDFDQEAKTLAAVFILLNRLTFDGQWRVLNYVIVRLWGRGWLLGRPKGDQT